MRKDKLASNNIYHIYNRGVEKRIIFKNNQDYSRFIKGLLIFNDTKIVDDFNNRLRRIINKSHQREEIVDIIAFCLMPNHYHLLLRQRSDNGITEFMRKLGGGYANYFNLKYERVGALFQGKFKSVLIDNDRQLLYIPHYIHLNPLDLTMPHWREKKSVNKKQAIDFLSNYEWSSYRDYVGEDNFGIVINKDLLSEYFTEGEYKKDFNAFINDFDFENISDLTLE
ncbi:MAG: transposase [Patescibacteria group bacterium]